MKIKKVDKRIYNQKYLQDREIIWNKKLQHCKENNVPLWNGIVYYLDEFKNDEASIGLCEYKDIIFLSTKSVQEIQKEYGLDFNFLYINVQIFIRSNEGNLLFGLKHSDGLVEIIPVGGTLRLEEEKAIKSFNDIVEYAKKEISIETKIELDPDKLKYIDLIISNGICTFLFEYEAGSIDENTLNKGEFDGGVILKREELFETGSFKVSARLESLKTYLKILWRSK